MATRTVTGPVARRGSRRPAIARVMGVFNRIPKLILRSPLHRIMSGRLMLLSFTGRSSGRSCTTPVSYIVEDAGTLLIAGGAPWWANLRSGSPVSVRLGGRQRVAGVDVIREIGRAHV